MKMSLVEMKQARRNNEGGDGAHDVLLFLVKYHTKRNNKEWKMDTRWSLHNKIYELNCISRHGLCTLI